MEDLNEFLLKSKEWFEHLVETVQDYAKKYKESEKWLSTTLNSIGDAVIVSDRLGNIQFINPVAEDLTGFTREESLGKPIEAIFNIINEETRKSVENPVIKVIREGIIVGLANRTVLITKDRKEIPISDSGAPIKDDNGNIIGIVLIFRDITERRKAEEELQKSEEKYRNIVESIPIGMHMYQLDANNNLIFTGANPSADRILGLNNSQFIGKTIEEAFPPSANTEIPERYRQAAKEGKIWSTESITYEDELIQGAYAVTAFQISPTKMVASFYDITDRKKTEQKLNESEKSYREAYNRAEFYKDLFTHDINNILQNILSGIQLSENYIGDPKNVEKLKKYNNIIKDQIVRGAKLVSNIRKLSKLEETEISIKKVEICSILEKSIIYTENAYQDRNIDIQVDSVSKKLYIRANELLEDLFENILVNAIKYNENPTVEILVKISKEKKESINYLKMEFMDNGIGINDSKKSLIFQRGYREETSVHGMGLGLSLVKKIIETYNGKIWVEDRVKGDRTKGSNFIILIPEAG